MNPIALLIGTVATGAVLGVEPPPSQTPSVTPPQPRPAPDSDVVTPLRAVRRACAASMGVCAVIDIGEPAGRAR